MGRGAGRRSRVVAAHGLVCCQSRACHRRAIPCCVSLGLPLAHPQCRTGSSVVLKNETGDPARLRVSTRYGVGDGDRPHGQGRCPRQGRASRMWWIGSGDIAVIHRRESAPDRKSGAVSVCELLRAGVLADGLARCVQRTLADDGTGQRPQGGWLQQVDPWATTLQERPATRPMVVTDTLWDDFQHLHDGRRGAGSEAGRAEGG